MNPILFQAGGILAAIALIGYTFVSFATGAACENGTVVREAMRPLLVEVRSRSSLGRSELADRTLFLSIALALIAIPTENVIAGSVLAVGLMAARLSVQKITASEHPLMSIGAQFGADMAIGVLAPMALAHWLMGNWLLGATHLVVSLTLSWPPGGPGRRSGAWKPSWVAA